jgi:uncharacterized protein
MTRRVAVVGASAHRHKFGNKAVRAFRRRGYVVYPINPHTAEIEGLPAFRSVLDVPGPIDMATIYVPPRVGMEVIGDVARKGIAEVWLNPGSESDELVARARSLGLEPIEACSIMGIGETPDVDEDTHVLDTE